MTHGVSTAGRLLRATFARCVKHRTSMLSGALAFYALLSLAPALSFIVAAGGLFVGRGEARGDVIEWVSRTAGPGAAGIVSGVVDSTGSSSPFATIAGVASIFFGATMAFGALQDVLNLVWEVPAHERGFVGQFFFKRLVSFVAVTAAGILLVVSLLTDALLSAAIKFVPQELPATEFLLQAANFMVSLLLVTLLFALLYRILPDAWVAWGDVLTGAFATALLFSIGKLLIGLYLAHTTAGTAFGAAGSVVIFLLWVYYSAQIFLFGAEFTRVYASLQNRHTRASVDAPLQQDEPAAE